MFYLGRSYMINKLQKLHTYKIGSLAVLLGIFGLFGSSVFAQTAAGYGTVGNTENTTETVAGWLNVKCDAANWSCSPRTPTPAAWLTEEQKCKTQGSNFQWNNNKCESCKDPWVCCGVKLNTNVPFIGKCIRLWSDADTEDTTVVTEATAFPRLMWGLTKIMTTIILLVCFGGILVGGVMIASSGGEVKRATEGKALIGKVIIAIALLWTSGIILKLINPNFFW